MLLRGSLIPLAAAAVVLGDQPGEAVVRLTNQLHLTPEQVAAAQAYRRATEPPETPVFDRDAFQRWSTPKRLQFEAQVARQDAAALEARASAMETFYAVLSPDQKALFDKIEAPPSGKSAVAADPVVPSDVNFTWSDLRAPSTKEPDWLIRPDGEMISRVYPKAALRKNIEGRATIRCDTDQEGYLSDCIVSEEAPKGRGFGNAALELTGYMRMTPAMSKGVPVIGRVTVPLHFMPAETAAP